MKYLTSIRLTLSLAALVQLSQAYFYTTNIDSNSAWAAGQTVTVSWDPDTTSKEQPSPGSTYHVLLKTGEDLTQVPLGQVTGELPLDQTSYSFKLPENLPAGQYFVQYVSSDGVNNWSTRASVDGGTSQTPFSSVDNGEKLLTDIQKQMGGTPARNAELDDSTTDKDSTATGTKASSKATGTNTADDTATATDEKESSTETETDEASSAEETESSDSESATSQSSTRTRTASRTLTLDEDEPTNLPDDSAAVSLMSPLGAVAAMALAASSYTLVNML
ncbi:hypothetical protein H4R34_004514 [Dimargaris verticillata]|uniref:Yeast cell wall synthesis Kre9/Knh1-like N-terminal domain-containing protein n=1 Tax=Dimargaris verticillata TaxID=2761393 RepID=A0A9W8B2F4_9FUNG|nr:hypothetical protein H4R34_004514 [Dimargaris verticillata]